MTVERLYLSSRVHHAPRWRQLRDEAGWPIVASWIDESGPLESSSVEALWIRAFDEAGCASRVILYAEPDDFPLKGALIEVGAAIALGVPVFLVLPGVELEARNDRPIGSWIRHGLVRRCETLEEARTAPALPIPLTISTTLAAATLRDPEALAQVLEQRRRVLGPRYCPEEGTKDSWSLRRGLGLGGVEGVTHAFAGYNSVLRRSEWKHPTIHQIDQGYIQASSPEAAVAACDDAWREAGWFLLARELRVLPEPGTPR